MSLQHIENEKLGWLHTKAYRVKVVGESAEEHRKWCTENVRAGEWRVVSPAGMPEHSFFFKRPLDHTAFREKFFNSDRIMELD